jgi:hypothetical protein
MKLFISQFWSQILCFGIGLIAGMYGIWNVHTYLRDKAEIACNQSISDQKTKSAEACAEAANVTEKLTHEHDAKMSDLQRRINELKRVQPKSVRTSDLPSRTPGSNAAGADGLCGGNEISTEPLYDLAGKAQGSSLKVTGLQAYVNSIQPYIAKCEGR